jgi:iron-sulfur cluster repair protein YtfE (RIC family)
MKRHPSLVPLSHDHRRILFFAQVIKRGVPSFREAPTTTPEKLDYARSFSQHLLHDHLELEETVLLPILQGIDTKIDVLLGEIVAEHAAIRQRVRDLHVLSEEAVIEAALHELGTFVETHVRKEERQLFQGVQAVVDEPTLAQLHTRLAADIARRSAQD